MFLNRDGPDEARRRIDAMTDLGRLEMSHLQRYDALMAEAQIDLYCGDGAAALARVESEWAPLRRSFLLTVPSVSGEAYHLRLRALLAAASGAPAAARGRLLARARRDCRWLARRRYPWNRAYGLLAAAGLDALLGALDPARRKLEAAVASLDQVQTRMYAAAARRRLGRLVGGDQGQRVLAEGTAFMTAQGVVDPERMTLMLAPGFEA
jgi:hypothetical protein